MRIGPPLHLEKITAVSGQLFVLRRFQLPCFPFHWHYHPEVELTLIRKGKGLRYIGHSVESYEEGDICLLEGNLPHSWSSARKDGRVVSTVIQFLPETAGRDFWSLREMRSVAHLLEKSRGGYSIHGPVRQRIVKWMEMLEQLPLTSPRRVSVFIEMLGDLATGRGLRPLHPGGPPAVGPRPGRSQALLQTVLRYVENNSAREIIHQEVARLARLSPPAFCRFFKRQMGKTFSDHVNDVRLARACAELTDTDREIIGIAYLCGYNNLSHFNRRFRASFKCTPREYRRRISRGA